MPRRLVPSGVTGGSFLIDSVLFGQDVGESARGAARWAAPFFVSGEFSISSNTLFPMTAVRSYRCRNIYQVSLLKYKEHLVF